MPIIKNVKVGKHENVLIAQFGTGDILVTNGHLSEDENIKVLCLSQHDPKPVEDWDKSIPTGGTTEGLRSMEVQMEFNNVTSVDTVIRHLMEVRQDLVKIGK